MSDTGVEARTEASARRQIPRRVERALHRSAYLTVQRLRGRPVGAAMHRLAEWDALDARSYAELCRRRLEEMLRYASACVPLYRTSRWASALQGVDVGEVRHWPVLERQALIDGASQLLAEGFGALRINRRSSASTGVPVTVTWNPDALAWSWAAEYHPMLWHGLEIGSRTLRIWGSGRPLENYMLNRYFVPAHDLRPDRLDDALRYLETRRPELIWGSPSAVTELARHVGRQRGPARAPLVPYAKLGGEQVYPFQREEIRRYLGARVIEAYGCTEVGPIAAECPRGSMHILGANAHIEIFRDGAEVPDGELGEIVATTLINRGMPLVRCRIGDIGRISPEPCGCGLPQPVLTDLRGRASDLVLKADGTVLHGSVLGSALGRYVGKAPLGHAQKILFQQIDERNWKVQIESPQCADPEALDDQISQLVRETFGAECVAETELVAKIPREASGKFRYYRTPKEIAMPVRHAGLSDALFESVDDDAETAADSSGSGGQACAVGERAAGVRGAPPPSAV